MGRAVRRLHTGVVQRERATGTGGQSGGQGGAGDDGRQSVDATHPGTPRPAQWLPRCAAHGIRHASARQSALVVGSVGGGSQVSLIGRFTVVDVSGVVVGVATPCGLVGGNNGSEKRGASVL